MSAEEREVRLTAYALNDPGLSAEERAEIEREVDADAALQRHVAEVQELAHILCASLAAEVAATTPSAVPASGVPKREPARGRVPAAIALALMVLVGVATLGLPQKVRETAYRPTTAESREELERRFAPPNLKYSKSESLAVTPGERKSDGDESRTSVNYTASQGKLPQLAKKQEAAGFAEQPQANLGLPRTPGFAPAPGQGIGGGIGGGGIGGSGGIGGGGIGGGVPSLGGPPAAPGAASQPLGTNSVGLPLAPTPPGGLTDSRSFQEANQPKSAAGVPGGSPMFRSEFKLKQLKDGVEESRLEREKLAAQFQAANPTQPQNFYGLPNARDERAKGKRGEPAKDVAEAQRAAVAKPELRLQLHDRAERGAHAPGDQFPPTVENAFTAVAGQDALSTFGVDVDTASYAIARNYLKQNSLPPPNAVRLEEVVNYFRYQDKPPTGDDPFAVTVELAECPWQPGHQLARIGLKAKPIDNDKRPPSNLVFLIDVSGSMEPQNRLPLVKASLKLLVNQLGENDRVAMVVYAGASGVVLDSTSALNKAVILESLDRLQSGGSTNGAGGIHDAYEVAQKHFIKSGTNRVVLCTDGDFNVGTTSTEALVSLIEAKRKTGVFLSVFGFGMGNLRDEMLVKLAGKGNGNYGYIDTLREANKAFVEQMGGTLVTVAKDVKIQVEFNPATVKAYRLLGYEKRALAARDFADDTKDAGEMGAGHTVTALYELVPAGSPATANVEAGLRYQPAPKPGAVAAKPGEKPTEAFVVKMRHKKPDGDVSLLRELPVSNVAKSLREASEDFRFSAAAASFALVLRDSPYKGSATLASTLELAGGAMTFDPSGYRAEFVELVRSARLVAPGK